MTIIFGYTMENGIIHICKPQSETLQEIISSYISGASLKSIADELTEKGIEYADGKSLWNKNRIQRMLTDKRYLGNTQYPMLVDTDTYQKIQEIMAGRNTQAGHNREIIFSSSVVPLLCGKCKSMTRRQFDKRWKKPLRHICTNPDCKSIYNITDEALWYMAKKALQTMMKVTTETDSELLHTIRQLENEIECEMQCDDIDGESLQVKMYRLADLKYQQKRIPLCTQSDVGKMIPSSPEFIRELKSRVKAVVLQDNETIRLIGHDAGKE